MKFPQGTCMIVLLDALDKPKSERALRLCMEWQPLLEEMGVPAYIVSSSDTRLYSIPYFQLCSDLDCNLHRRVGAIRSKVIYGKSRDCIQGTIVVMQDKDVVQINHRVNEKAMRAACMCALKKRYQELLKKVQKIN